MVNKHIPHILSKKEIFSNSSFLEIELQYLSLHDLWMENRIRQVRKALGLTQQELAGKVNTTSSTIHKLERGHNRLTTIWMTRLAKALDCKPTDLLPETLAQLTPPKTIDPKVLENVLVRLGRILKEEKIVLKPAVEATLIVDLYEIALKHQSKGLNARNPEYMHDFSAALAKAAKRK